MDTLIGAVVATAAVLLIARYSEEGLRPPWSETAKQLVIGVVVVVAITLAIDALGGGTVATVAVLLVVIAGIAAFTRLRAPMRRRPDAS